MFFFKKSTILQNIIKMEPVIAYHHSNEHYKLMVTSILNNTTK